MVEYIQDSGGRNNEIFREKYLFQETCYKRSDALSIHWKDQNSITNIYIGYYSIFLVIVA